MEPEKASDGRDYQAAFSELQNSQRASVASLADDIARSRVPVLHRCWIAAAGTELNVAEEWITAVYLLETYHRNKAARLIEGLALVPSFVLATALGLPRPDFSIGICQIRPSRWRACRHPTIERSNNLGLRDLLALIRPKESIFAAAEIISTLIQTSPPPDTSISCRRRATAELLAVKHFGYTREQVEFDGYWLADLLEEIASRVGRERGREDWKTETGLGNSLSSSLRWPKTMHLQDNSLD